MSSDSFEDRSAIVQELVSVLDEQQKQAISLRFYSEKMIAEVASAMEISESDVVDHLRTGICALVQNLINKLSPIRTEEAFESEEIQWAISDLSPNERMAIFHRYYSEFALLDVSDMMRKDPDRVKNLCLRGAKKIAVTLFSLLPDPS